MLQQERKEGGREGKKEQEEEAWYIFNRQNQHNTRSEGKCQDEPHGAGFEDGAAFQDKRRRCALSFGLAFFMGWGG